MYIQSEGLAMGEPSSSILSEVCLQYLENTKIDNLLLSHNVVGYFRYVDDILVVYNEDITNIDILLHQFNNLTVKVKFTIEKKQIESYTSWT
jgi:glycyl-tRNA synthetase beta subunit